MKRRMYGFFVLMAIVAVLLCSCQQTEDAEVKPPTIQSTITSSTTISTATSTTTTTSEVTTTSTSTATTSTTKITTTSTSKITTTKKPTTTTTTTTKKAVKNPEYGTAISIHPAESGIEFEGWGWRYLSTTFTWKVDEYGGWWARSSTTSMNSKEVNEWGQFGWPVMHSLGPTHEGTIGESYTYTVWVWLEK